MAAPLDNSHVLVLRRSLGSDPLAAGAIDVAIAITHIEPVVIVVAGGGKQSPDGHIFGSSNTKRRRFEIDCLGFQRNGDGLHKQSFGRYTRMAERVLSGPDGSRLWIYRCFERGSNTNIPLKRDDYDHAAPTTDAYVANKLWNLQSSGYQVSPETYPYTPAGILPYEVVSLEDVDPQHEGSGNYSLSFTLWGATAYTA